MGPPQEGAHDGPSLSTAPVTRMLAVVIVGVFVVMVVRGVGLFQPSVDGLIAWGANFGPRTLDGEPWRLLSSMFVHIGLLHLGFNLYFLLQVGTLVERFFGSRRYLVLYLASGALGSLASVAWHGLRVSAGASGALFGIYGGLLAFFLRQRSKVPKEVRQAVLRDAMTFLGLNLFLGLSIEGIDMAAHTGGLVAGLLVGLVLCPTTPEARRSWGVPVLAAAVLAVVTWFGLSMVPRGVVEFEQALENFGTAESQLIDTLNTALGQVQSEELSMREYAAVLDDTILPGWRAAREAFEATPMPGLPSDLEERRGKLAEYMRLREEGWTLQARAIANNDEAALNEAQVLQQQAEAILKDL